MSNLDETFYQQPRDQYSLAASLPFPTFSQEKDYRAHQQGRRTHYGTYNQSSNQMFTANAEPKRSYKELMAETSSEEEEQSKDSVDSFGNRSENDEEDIRLSIFDNDSDDSNVYTEQIIANASPNTKKAAIELLQKIMAIPGLRLETLNRLDDAELAINCVLNKDFKKFCKDSKEIKARVLKMLKRISASGLESNPMFLRKFMPWEELARYIYNYLEKDGVLQIQLVRTQGTNLNTIHDLDSGSMIPISIIPSQIQFRGDYINSLKIYWSKAYLEKRMTRQIFPLCGQCNKPAYRGSGYCKKHCDEETMDEEDIEKYRIELPPLFAQWLKNLVSLTFYAITSTSITNVLASLSNLKTLVIEQFMITDWSDDLFLPLKSSLVSLTIANAVPGYELEKLPYSVTKFQNLVQLQIVNVGLTMLPSSLGNLGTTLTHLNLSKNKLRNGAIPATLPKLTSLIQLNLSSNLLTEFPKEIQYLIELKVLNLSQNSIEKLVFPTNILNKLEILYLGGNGLKFIVDPTSNQESWAFLTLPKLHVLSFDQDENRKLLPPIYPPPYYQYKNMDPIMFNNDFIRKIKAEQFDNNVKSAIYTFVRFLPNATLTFDIYNNRISKAI